MVRLTDRPDMTLDVYVKQQCKMLDVKQQCNNATVLNIRTSPFIVLGIYGGCFHFHCFLSIATSVSTQCSPYQTPHFAPSKLVLHCLHNVPKWVSWPCCTKHR